MASASQDMKGRNFCILRDDCANSSCCQKAIDAVTRALVEEGQCHLECTDKNKYKVLSQVDCVLAFVSHGEHWWNAFVSDVQICQERKPRPLMIPVLFHLEQSDAERIFDPESPLAKCNLVDCIEINDDDDDDWITKIVNAFKSVNEHWISTDMTCVFEFLERLHIIYMSLLCLP